MEMTKEQWVSYGVENGYIKGLGLPFIEIRYDGKYPNLCSGNLTVVVNGEEYEFPEHCMASGGSAYINGDAHITSGPWSIHEWPENFPEIYKNYVLLAINEQVKHGCCGGCL
jgi:hypothetical protein